MRLCTRMRLDGEEVEILDLSLVDHSHWEELEEQDPSVVHLEGWIIREELRCLHPAPDRELRGEYQAPPALVLDVTSYDGGLAAGNRADDAPVGDPHRYHLRPFSNLTSFYPAPEG